MIDWSVKPEDLYKTVDGRDPSPFMRPVLNELIDSMAQRIWERVHMKIRSTANQRHLVSRNKREGWYSGWRPLTTLAGHVRSGKPSKDVDWIPYPDPLNKRIVARYREPVEVFGFE